jgi:hypothetical protein
MQITDFVPQMLATLGLAESCPRGLGVKDSSASADVQQEPSLLPLQRTPADGDIAEVAQACNEAISRH